MTPMTFEIRSATPADGRAIAEVHKETWADTYSRWIPDVMDGYDLDRSTENWAGIATQEGSHLMVAEDDNGVAGFAVSGPARGEGVDGAGEVYAVYVRPSRHGKGIGQALMADALGWLAAAGYPECILWVAEPSTRTRRFYEHVGFVLDEGVTEPWRSITTVRYRLPLVQQRDH
ncbi:GNAT family N-acetyltransferase [Virgisporangium ochraceum]|nr:GNAT family N-acetyltransferase [Virgisporangium ochraceum]